MSHPKFLDIENGHIELMHGGGGRATEELVNRIFMHHFANPMLLARNDQAVFSHAGGRLVMATDAHVIVPLFFPGGDIGSLAVHGTINDVAMAGARPLYLAASFIIEEGFPLRDLNKIAESMGRAANQIDVPIITGDTKVVERGKGDGVFITTTGVGSVFPGIEISGDKARPGHAVLLSGSIGDHGLAVMAAREGSRLKTRLLSDSAPLHDLVRCMVEAVPSICCLRDPTRGGLGAALNELALQSQVGIRIRENTLPIRPEVAAMAEILGLDPLFVANEGKLVAICPADVAEKLLQIMHQHEYGQQAAIIGEVVTDPNHFVQMETAFGGQRIVQWLSGEQLPRIC